MWWSWLRADSTQGGACTRRLPCRAFCRAYTRIGHRNWSMRGSRSICLGTDAALWPGAGSSCCAPSCSASASLMAATSPIVETMCPSCIEGPHVVPALSCVPSLPAALEPGACLTPASAACISQHPFLLLPLQSAPPPGSLHLPHRLQPQSSQHSFPSLPPLNTYSCCCPCSLLHLRVASTCLTCCSPNLINAPWLGPSTTCQLSLLTLPLCPCSLNHFMKRSRLPLPVRRRLREFLRYRRTHRSLQDYPQLMQVLSPALRAEVAASLQAKWVLLVSLSSCQTCSGPCSAEWHRDGTL